MQLPSFTFQPKTSSTAILFSSFCRRRSSWEWVGGNIYKRVVRGDLERICFIYLYQELSWAAENRFRMPAFSNPDAQDWLTRDKCTECHRVSHRESKGGMNLMGHGAKVLKLSKFREQLSWGISHLLEWSLHCAFLRPAINFPYN